MNKIDKLIESVNPKSIFEDDSSDTTSKSISNKKYELTDDTISIDGKTLYRIKALKSFGDVKEGDLGGYIEKEDNLSHNENCWVYENAEVYGDAWITDYAKVFGNAKVYGYAKVHENAWVYGNAKVYDDAKVHENAWVYGNAKVYGSAWVNYVVNTGDITK
jgi:predicted acyltransferase (DUF342 family)